MSEPGMFCFASVKIGEPDRYGEHFVEFSADPDAVTISFPNATGVSPETDRELVEAASTISISHAHFLAAMQAFCGSIAAFRELPASVPETERFSLHQCEKPIGDGSRCTRSRGHLGRCAVTVTRP